MTLCELYIVKNVDLSFRERVADGTSDVINLLHISQVRTYCAVPENIHTHPMEGQWKFQGGGGSQKPKF